MATQKCPKCNSGRIRLGYRPTSLLLKLVFRYNLLCDECNWEFNGFAIPGTVQRKLKRKKNSKDFAVDDLADLKNHQSKGSLEEIDMPKKSQTVANTNFFGEIAEPLKANVFAEHKVKIKKKVRVKLH